MAEKQEDNELLSISEAKELIKELGGYKKVAEEIGVSEGGLKSSISSGSMGRQTLKSLELLNEIFQCKKKMKIIEQFKTLLK